jgi:hypothetical protein
MDTTQVLRWVRAAMPGAFPVYARGGGRIDFAYRPLREEEIGKRVIGLHWPLIGGDRVSLIALSGAQSRTERPYLQTHHLYGPYVTRVLYLLADGKPIGSDGPETAEIADEDTAIQEILRRLDDLAATGRMYAADLMRQAASR